MNPSALFWRVVLSLFLVVGQAGAIAHELSHGFDDIQRHSQDQGKGQPEVCEKCLAFAGFTSALGSAVLTPDAASPAPTQGALQLPIGHRNPIERPYQSRAPPIS